MSPRRAGTVLTACDTQVCMYLQALQAPARPSSAQVALDLPTECLQGTCIEINRSTVYSEDCQVESGVRLSIQFYCSEEDVDDKSV